MTGCSAIVPWLRLTPFCLSHPPLFYHHHLSHSSASGRSPPPLLLLVAMSYPQQQRRSARLSRPQPPNYPTQQPYSQPMSPPPPTPPPPGAYYGQPPPSPRSGHPNITFQTTERGDRQGTLDGPRQRTIPSAYNNQFSPPHPDAESGDFLEESRVGRKKSLVRPDREKIEPGHRQWHYRTRVEQMADDTRVGVQPSSR
jgi:chitin synthase